MKKLLTNIGFKSIATLLLIVFSQVSVFADTNTQTDSSLSGGMVVVYFGILLLLILAPVFKKANR